MPDTAGKCVVSRVPESPSVFLSVSVGRDEVPTLGIGAVVTSDDGAGSPLSTESTDTAEDLGGAMGSKTSIECTESIRRGPFLIDSRSDGSGDMMARVLAITFVPFLPGRFPRRGDLAGGAISLVSAVDDSGFSLLVSPDCCCCVGPGSIGWNSSTDSPIDSADAFFAFLGEDERFLPFLGLFGAIGGSRGSRSKRYAEEVETPEDELV